MNALEQAVWAAAFALEVQRCIDAGQSASVNWRAPAKAEQAVTILRAGVYAGREVPT